MKLIKMIKAGNKQITFRFPVVTNVQEVEELLQGYDLTYKFEDAEGPYPSLIVTGNKQEIIRFAKEVMTGNWENDEDAKEFVDKFIPELNKLVNSKNIKASDLDKQIYNFLIDYIHEDSDNAEEIVKTHDYVIVNGKDELDLGYNFVHEVLGDLSEVFNKERFFDFAKYGQLFIESGEFSKNDDGVYVDSEGINSGADNEYDLGKFIFKDFYSEDFENINKEDLEKCFNYEKFGKMLLEEADFYKLNDEYYIQC